MSRALWILGAIALVAVLGIGLTQAGGDSGTTSSGDAPPAALSDSLRELEGAPAPLARLHDAAGRIRPGDFSDFEAEIGRLRGYPVVVNAWASWCGPCKLEFPFFREVSTRLGKRVAFLGLNSGDNREDAQRFLAKQPVPYPHVEDGDMRIIQKAGGTGGLPATIFYDADGERAYIHQGQYESAQDLIDDIERYTGA